MPNVPVESCASPALVEGHFRTDSLGSCLFSAAVLFSSQMGSTNSAVPSAPAYNSHELWSSLSPAGLSDVVKDLCDALRPHLNSQ